MCCGRRIPAPQKSNFPIHRGTGVHIRIRSACDRKWAGARQIVVPERETALLGFGHLQKLYPPSLHRFELTGTSGQHGAFEIRVGG